MNGRADTITGVQASGEQLRILEMGCGRKKRHATSTGIDISALSQADVIHDLNDYPYPFGDEEFDLIICEHVLEHLSDVVKTMEEIHRLLKPGGVVRLELPYFTSVYAYSDPTHKHFFTSRSFDYFLDGTAVSEFSYSSARFALQTRELVTAGGGVVGSAARWLTNRFIDVYESRFAFMWPRHTIRFELKAVK